MPAEIKKVTQGRTVDLDRDTVTHRKQVQGLWRYRLLLPARTLQVTEHPNGSFAEDGTAHRWTGAGVRVRVTAGRVVKQEPDGRTRVWVSYNP